MALELYPQIYALLVCASAEPDPETGGWLLKPFSHLVVDSLPAVVTLLVAVEVMAPPGSYTLDLSAFAAATPGAAHSLPARDFLVQEGKNFEFLLALHMRFEAAGLHFIQAEVRGYHRLRSPLRVSVG